MRSIKESTSDRGSSKQDYPNWEKLLVDAVTQPGLISTAYSRFWNYSFGNQILAMVECSMRGIDPGPIHTFKGWLDLGRHVKKGEKAITLCMPVKVKRKRRNESADSEAIQVAANAEGQLTSSGGVAPKTDGKGTVTVFTYKPNWFVLSQTEGTDYVPTVLPEWNEECAFQTLSIKRVPFNHANGNCQGFALDRSVSVSPIAVLPHKTLFHELAHVVLGHTAEGTSLDDHDRTPVNLREVEAECVALICCESLNLKGIPESRGYIQNWLGKESIPDRSVQKIFKAADAILKAGYPKNAEAPAHDAS